MTVYRVLSNDLQQYDKLLADASQAANQIKAEAEAKAEELISITREEVERQKERLADELKAAESERLNAETLAEDAKKSAAQAEKARLALETQKADAEMRLVELQKSVTEQLEAESASKTLLQEENETLRAETAQLKAQAEKERERINRFRTEADKMKEDAKLSANKLKAEAEMIAAEAEELKAEAKRNIQAHQPAERNVETDTVLAKIHLDYSQMMSGEAKLEVKLQMAIEDISEGSDARAQFVQTFVGNSARALDVSCLTI